MCAAIGTLYVRSIMHTMRERTASVVLLWEHCTVLLGVCQEHILRIETSALNTGPPRLRTVQTVSGTYVYERVSASCYRHPRRLPPPLPAASSKQSPTHPFLYLQPPFSVAAAGPCHQHSPPRLAAPARPSRVVSPSWRRCHRPPTPSMPRPRRPDGHGRHGTAPLAGGCLSRRGWQAVTLHTHNKKKKKNKAMRGVGSRQTGALHAGVATHVQAG